MSVADDKFKDLDFEDLQAAVESSAKGRWFLEEYGRRLRANDTGSILEAIARLERVITDNTAAIAPPAPEQPLRQHQLRYFKKDEELFVEAKAEPSLTVVEPHPESGIPPAVAEKPAEPRIDTRQAQSAEPRGARLKITRTNSPAVLEAAIPAVPATIPDLDIEPDAAQPQPAPKAEAVEAKPAMAAAKPLFGEAAQRKQRIVVTRQASEQEPSIPLVDEFAAPPLN